MHELPAHALSDRRWGPGGHGGHSGHGYMHGGNVRPPPGRGAAQPQYTRFDDDGMPVERLVHMHEERGVWHGSYDSSVLPQQAPHVSTREMWGNGDRAHHMHAMHAYSAGAPRGGCGASQHGQRAQHGGLRHSGPGRTPMDRQEQQRRGGGTYGDYFRPAPQRHLEVPGVDRRGLPHGAMHYGGRYRTDAGEVTQGGGGGDRAHAGVHQHDQSVRLHGLHASTDRAGSHGASEVQRFCRGDVGRDVGRAHRRDSVESGGGKESSARGDVSAAEKRRRRGRRRAAAAADATVAERPAERRPAPGGAVEPPARLSVEREDRHGAVGDGDDGSAVPVRCRGEGSTMKRLRGAGTVTAPVRHDAHACGLRPWL